MYRARKGARPCSRHVPDRRAPRALLLLERLVAAALEAFGDRRGHRAIDARVDAGVGLPAAARVLEDARVVKRRRRWIEGRIGPDVAQAVRTFAERCTRGRIDRRVVRSARDVEDLELGRSAL